MKGRQADAGRLVSASKRLEPAAGRAPFSAPAPALTTF
jgi:hypothetical protein